MQIWYSYLQLHQQPWIKMGVFKRQFSADVCVTRCFKKGEWLKHSHHTGDRQTLLQVSPLSFGRATLKSGLLDICGGQPSSPYFFFPSMPRTSAYLQTKMLNLFRLSSFRQLWCLGRACIWVPTWTNSIRCRQIWTQTEACTSPSSIIKSGVCLH